jgi:CCR4-NOT transcription complex subunit 9
MNSFKLDRIMPSNTIFGSFRSSRNGSTNINSTFNPVNSSGTNLGGVSNTGGSTNLGGVSNTGGSTNLGGVSNNGDFSD